MNKNDNTIINLNLIQFHVILDHNVYDMHIINIYHILILNLLHLFVNTYNIQNQDHHLLITLVNVHIILFIFHIFSHYVYNMGSLFGNMDIYWMFLTIIISINNNMNVYNSFILYFYMHLNI
jgi:hypothetical protein